MVRPRVVLVLKGDFLYSIIFLIPGVQGACRLLLSTTTWWSPKFTNLKRILLFKGHYNRYEPPKSQWGVSWIVERIEGREYKLRRQREVTTERTTDPYHEPKIQPNKLLDDTVSSHLRRKLGSSEPKFKVYIINDGQLLDRFGVKWIYLLVLLLESETWFFQRFKFSCRLSHRKVGDFSKFLTV